MIRKSKEPYTYLEIAKIFKKFFKNLSYRNIEKDILYQKSNDTNIQINISKNLMMKILKYKI